MDAPAISATIRLMLLPPRHGQGDRMRNAAGAAATIAMPPSAAMQPMQKKVASNQRAQDTDSARRSERAVCPPAIVPAKTANGNCKLN
jgi:hypothetical protein